MADFKSIFEDPGAPVPSGDATDVGGTRGGFVFPDGRSESPNLSGLPALQTTVSPTGGDPGVNGQVDMPPVASPGTIHTGDFPGKG